MENTDLFAMRELLSLIQKFTVEAQEKIVSCFSMLPSERILSILGELGIDQDELQGKYIMSIGEGIPFLANSLAEKGGFVTAVDPLYKDTSSHFYDYFKKMKLEDLSAVVSLPGVQDIEGTKQLQKLFDMSQQTKEIFYQQLFSNTNIKFNDSCADTIYGVEDSSQDYILLSFLLNNLESKDDVFHALVEALNKLKRGGKLIIIGPQNFNKTKEDIQILKKRYQYTQFEYSSMGEIYPSFAFTK